MKILVVGLGSMGKRRIRCLQSLGVSDISGFDPRVDRQSEAVSAFGISMAKSIDCSMIAAFDAVIISVPPDKHHYYMQLCTEAKRSYFVEASVIDEGLDALDEAARTLNIVAAPSATLLFHPAVSRISKIAHDGQIGRVANFIYHSGQYLPDWHPYEKVSDFYVSNPATGGAREFVPFEMSWLVRCFGWPEKVFCRMEKTVRIPGAEQIDDTYVLSLKFASHPGIVVVDVVSRFATRSLTIVGDAGHLTWDWNDSSIKILNIKTGKMDTEAYQTGTAAIGYNPNIGEQMYIDEVDEFLKACQGQGSFRNTLGEDAKILRLLLTSEESSRLGEDSWLRKS